MIRKPYEQFNTYKTLAFALTWFALEKKNIFLVFCDSAFGSKLEVYNKKKTNVQCSSCLAPADRTKQLNSHILRYAARSFKFDETNQFELKRSPKRNSIFKCNWKERWAAGRRQLLWNSNIYESHSKRSTDQSIPLNSVISLAEVKILQMQFLQIHSLVR